MTKEPARELAFKCKQRSAGRSNLDLVPVLASERVLSSLLQTLFAFREALVLANSHDGRSVVVDGGGWRWGSSAMGWCCWSQAERRIKCTSKIQFLVCAEASARTTSCLRHGYRHTSVHASFPLQREEGNVVLQTASMFPSNGVAC